MAGLDPNAIRIMQNSQPLVPRDILEAQMEKQETLQNVNLAFSIANSETIFKHGIDGSNNARELIDRSLVVLVAYMRDVRLNGQELFPDPEKDRLSEPGIDAPATQ